MNREQNLSVLAHVRRDLALIGADVYVPEGMTHEEKLETFGEALKKRQVRRIIQFPTYARADMTEKQRKAVEESIKARGEEETVLHPPPPTVQIYGASYSATVSQAHVTNALSGPCMLDHILLYTAAYIAGLNAPEDIALHACTSPNVGPFEGDIPIFRMEDPKDLIAPLNRSAIQIYKGRYETLVGWRSFDKWELFPRIPIPFSTFYLNLTVGKTNHPASCHCTVDFGPIEVPRGRVMGISAIEPRTARPPAVAKAPPAEPTIAKRQFASYAQVKEYQALGNTIVWATTRNTGRRDYPIDISVVERVPMYLAPNMP